MDVIFYFVISLLIATVFCYLIFLTKNNFQRKDIEKEIAALQTVGTYQQKEYAKEVINYQKKINDFASLLENHGFASNVFAFMEAQTMPNVWFKKFDLDKKNNGVQLSGESDDMDSFSRQVAVFEKNKYVKNIGTLNSSLGKFARVAFNIDLALDQNIFSYLSIAPSILEITMPSEQPPSPTGTPTDQTIPANDTTADTSSSQILQEQNLGEQGGQQLSQSPEGTPSSEKLITSFHLLLEPEVVGAVDETNHTVTLDVTYSADVKNLTPSIIVSPEATVLPASNVSQDFTSPVTYMVTAEDSSIQNYEVKVIVGAPQEVSKKSSQSGYIALIIILLIGIITVAVVIFFFWRRRPKKQQTNINKIT